MLDNRTSELEDLTATHTTNLSKLLSWVNDSIIGYCWDPVSYNRKTNAITNLTDSNTRIPDGYTFITFLSYARGNTNTDRIGLSYPAYRYAQLYVYAGTNSDSNGTCRVTGILKRNPISF